MGRVWSAGGGMTGHEGAWVVKHLPLDFDLGYDFRVMRSDLESGSVLGVRPAQDFLSLPLSPSSPLAVPPPPKKNPSWKMYLITGLHIAL